MNRVCSIFSQILHFVPRLEFAAAVKETKAERHARGFSSWDQFGAMMFCQLGHAQSLREITGGLAASEGKLKHLGMDGAPKRSTLAYMPTSTARGHCTRMYFTACWAGARAKRRAASVSFGSSTSCCRSTVR